MKRRKKKHEHASFEINIIYEIRIGHLNLKGKKPNEKKISTNGIQWTERWSEWVLNYVWAIQLLDS